MKWRLFKNKWFSLFYFCVHLHCQTTHHALMSEPRKMMNSYNWSAGGIWGPSFLRPENRRISNFSQKQTIKLTERTSTQFQDKHTHLQCQTSGHSAEQQCSHQGWCCRGTLRNGFHSCWWDWCDCPASPRCLALLGILEMWERLHKTGRKKKCRKHQESFRKRCSSDTVSDIEAINIIIVTAVQVPQNQSHFGKKKIQKDVTSQCQ